MFGTSTLAPRGRAILANKASGAGDRASADELVLHLSSLKTVSASEASKVVSSLSFVVSATYLELYNEVICDLLNPGSQGLKIRQHIASGIYVEGLTEVQVSSFYELQRLITEGNRARATAATRMNERSSRSHAVFTLTLEQRHVVPADESGTGAGAGAAASDGADSSEAAAAPLAARRASFTWSTNGLSVIVQSQ